MKIRDLDILVLEDEPIIAFALEDILIEEGARVELVQSQEQAAALLDSRSFHCAILDVNVHGEKSYPIAERLQSMGIPIVFATGYGKTIHPESFEGIPTVTKPYSPQEIVGAIAAQV